MKFEIFSKIFLTLSANTSTLLSNPSVAFSCLEKSQSSIPILPIPELSPDPLSLSEPVELIVFISSIPINPFISLAAFLAALPTPLVELLKLSIALVALDTSEATAPIPELESLFTPNNRFINALNTLAS